MLFVCYINEADIFAGAVQQLIFPVLCWCFWQHLSKFKSTTMSAIDLKEETKLLQQNIYATVLEFLTLWFLNHD